MLTRYHRSRLLPIIAASIAFVMFWYAGEWFAVPNHAGFEASVMQDANPFLSFGIVAVVFLVAGVVGTIITRTIRADAGIFAAAIGLAALSLRGGPLRFVLFYSSGPAVYLGMIFELIFIFTIVAGVFFITRLLFPYPPEAPDALDDTSSHVGGAIATHAIVMTLLMLVLCQTDKKTQVVASLFIAGFLGTSVAVSLFSPTGKTGWYLVAPLLVGIFGYMMAWMYPTGLPIGKTTQPLARPVPLDYASAGLAGSLLGYWIGGKMIYPVVELLLFGDVGKTVQERFKARHGEQLARTETKPG